MKITRISVTARHLFQNRQESYSNFSVGVTLDAELHDGDRVDQAIKQLQIEADCYITNHRTQIEDRLTATARALGDTDF